MKVMIVARGYPSEKYKMNGIFEFDQAKALSKAGVEIFYVAIDVRSIRRWRNWGIERKIIEGVKVYCINIPCGNIPKKIRNKISVWALKKIYKIVKLEQGEPDIIHAHFIGIGFLVSQVFQESKIPLILTEHYSGMNQDSLSDYYMKIGNLTYSRMDKIIAVSRYLGENIIKKFGVEIEVIPNIVDLSCFSYNPDYADDSDEDFIFISVGRLHPDKRMHFLIDSFYIAFKDEKRVKLLIYGDGVDKKKLEKRISELGVDEQIVLKGLVDRNQISNQMKSSDCFVLASRLETFGVAFIEALAMGLPVISTRCGGPDDFVNENNGVLVDSDSIEELAKVLNFMYKNRHKYDSLRISEEIKFEYNSETIASKLVSIYNSMTK